MGIAPLTVEEIGAVRRSGLLACSRCAEVKPLEEFTPDVGNALGVRRFCKACRNKEVKRRYDANPEPILERNRRNMKPEYALYKKAWYEENKPRVLASMLKATRRRRARLAENDARRVTPRDLARLKARQRDRCFYCDELAKLETDHLIPLSRGGRHSIGNIVLACRDCNRAKWTRLVAEFRHGKPVHELAKVG